MSSDKAPFEVLSGEPHIYEKLKDFKFRISADTFFQVKLFIYDFDYRPVYYFIAFLVAPLLKTVCGNLSNHLNILVCGKDS